MDMSETTNGVVQSDAKARSGMGPTEEADGSQAYGTGADGLRLAQDWYGPVDGKPVLLLHGAGQTRHSWKRLASELGARGYRVASVDLRGHGDSEWDPEQRYTMPWFVEDLLALTRQFDTPPALVGASLGGLISMTAIGQQTAAGLPPPASSLTLVDVVTRVKVDGAARIHGFMRAWPDGFDTLEDAANAVAEYLPHRTKPATPDGLRRNLRLDANGRWRWHWDPAFLGEAAETRMQEMRETLESMAAHVGVPTLIVRGGRSELVDEEGVAAMLELIPHARTATVAQAGHMVAGDRNDDFNSVVGAFLDEVSVHA
jgi:pimeloyl-ACP methyl ester carboxylesterase